MMKKSKIIVIMGPTASGKTEASIHLAKKYNAEIINADKEQMYKEVNVGTAKITEKEKEGIKHHLIDFLELNENFTVKDYQEEGRKILNNLIEEGKNVIIVGGTGLYIKALLYDYNFGKETKTLNYSAYTNKELKQKVDSIYKENNIHENNRKRLERFLSHYESSGEIIKNYEEKDKALYDFTLICLMPDKNELYQMINKRVDKMINAGLIEETEKLKEYSALKNIIGYKELLPYLDGKITKEESIDLIKKDTRHYAKRQITWFKHQFTNVNSFIVDYTNFNNTIKKIEDYLSSLYKEWFIKHMLFRVKLKEFFFCN